jgi:cytochrome c-type biogenesis protein CcmH
MVTQATEQARQNPQDKAAWAMLAHSHEMLGQFAEASKAYAKLAALAPDDAQVLADYADALGVANGRSLLGEPEALIQRALARDAKNVKALMLASTLAMEKNDTAAAIQQLERARSVSGDAALNRQIDQSLAQLKAPPTAPASAAAASAAAASAPAAAASKPRLSVGPAQVAGRVWLAQDLAATAPADATVFIMALPAQGSRMPVALLRKKVKDLPLAFTLDESMAMVKDSSLAQVANVVVVARVSLRGDVNPKAGDLQGLSAPVPVGTSGLKLEISEVLK